MSKNEFDDLLRKKIAEEELEYDPENWIRISRLLPPSLPNRSKKWTIGLGIAAALALLLATTLLVKLMDQTSQIHTATSNQNTTALSYEQARVSQSVIQSEAPEAGNKIKKKESVAQVGSANGQPAAAIGGQKYVSEPGSGKRHDHTPEKYLAAPQSEVIAGAVRREISEMEAEHPAHPESLDSVMEKHTGPPAGRLSGQSPIRGQERNMLAGSAYDPHPSKGLGQTLVAFGGGVNYGSLNAGYSLNVTAQQKIGDRFFFDGTVAVMYNNNTPNNVVNSGAAPVSGNTAARPAQKPTLSTPAVAPVASLYYIQFNPSFGYQLADNLAISVGGDLQQMLVQDNEFRKYQVTEAGTRVFPGLDLGFTGKTEYSITPQIQAGLIFREGLNNLIKPNQELPFVNRRYIQVQFKYNIPISR